MRKLTFVVLILLPSLAAAQAGPQGGPRSSQSAFAGALAENLSTALAQIDDLQRQLADVTKERDELKAKAEAK